MKKKNRKGWIKKFIAVALTLALAFGMGINAPKERVVAATDLWKIEASSINNDAYLKNVYLGYGIMTFQGYKQAVGEIPTGMLLVGTYLIHRDAFCDALLQLANDSASLANQEGEYYKSELASGQWLDIGGANGLEDLGSKGNVVNEDELNEMWITCVVEANGNIHKPGSSSNINPFDIDDPYNLIYLPALDPIQEAYQSFLDMKEDDRTKSQKAHIQAVQCALTNFSGIKVTRKGGKDDNGNKIEKNTVTYSYLTTGPRNAQTNNLDSTLRSLMNDYYNCCRDGKIEEAAQFLSLAANVDAERRVAVYEWLAGDRGTDGETQTAGSGNRSRLDTLFTMINNCEGTSAGKLTIPEDEDDPTVAPDQQMTEAMNNAVESCEEYLSKYEGMILEDGSTIMDHDRYEWGTQVREQTKTSTTSGLLVLINHLRDLESIRQGVVAHRESELSLIDTNLLPDGEQKYKRLLTAGQSAEYTEMKGQEDAKESTLKELLDDQKATVNGAVSELQIFIRAHVLRVEKQPAIDYVNERINWAQAQYYTMPKDDFEGKANATVDEHIKWLKDLLAELLGGSTGDDTLDGLLEQKADYEAALQDAYDNDDGDLADKIKKDLDDLNAQINDRKNELQGGGEGSSDTTDETTKDDLDKAVENLVDGETGRIENDDFTQTENTIKALTALGAKNGLNKILNSLKNNNGASNLIRAANEGISAADNSGLNADIGDGNDGSGGSGGGGGGGGGGGSGDGSGDGGGGGGTGDGSEGGSGSGDGSGDGSGSGSGDGSGDGSGSGSGSGDGSGSGSGAGDGSGDGSGTGDGSGADAGDLNDLIDDALNDTFGDSADGLDDADKAAATAGLSKFGNGEGDGSDAARKAALDYAMGLLNDLLKDDNGFIYQQYLRDMSQEFVDFAAIDKCRRYTRFRYVHRDDHETMQQTVGSAAFMFQVGSNKMVDNDGSKQTLDVALKTQTDPYIVKGNNTTQYPYLDETDSGKYLKCTGYYVPTTDIAILITEKMDSKITQLLDALETAFS